MFVAAMTPSAEIAALLFSVLFSFVLTLYVLRLCIRANMVNNCLSNGVIQPFAELGWWKWMYRLSPYTYLMEGLVGQGAAIMK
ncbi:hypothetical protein C0989_001029 [Termitomyces sp. Mn162]|nr:hypothetical protein C0989_001029 [Termitomyces sp. Mn162]